MYIDTKIDVMENVIEKFGDIDIYLKLNEPFALEDNHIYSKRAGTGHLQNTF